MSAAGPPAGHQGERQLIELLVEARRRGLVGPGPVEAHLEHARGFGEVVEPPGRVLAVDVGSGAGLPGLVLAGCWPPTSWALLDGRARSADFLRHAVAVLGLEQRVSVIEGRAEQVGHDERLRGAAALVTCRGLGAPAVAAECAAPLLMVGGRLVVSEPPGSSGERWPPDGLAQLGLGPVEVRTARGYRFAVASQDRPCPPRYARRVGVPAKRPLF
jgi:16S rRNA (guanine527-N7)-methyltransferase